MKSLLVALVLVGFGGVIAAAERTVVVAKGEKAFVVEKNETVRLTGNGIAGAKIEAKVDGPAKVESTSVLRELVDGKAIIGSQVKEFDLKPTGAGKVTVTITVTSPIPGTKPEVTKFQFEVK